MYAGCLVRNACQHVKENNGHFHGREWDILHSSNPAILWLFVAYFYLFIMPLGARITSEWELCNSSPSLRSLPCSWIIVWGLEECLGCGSDSHRRISSPPTSSSPPWLHPQWHQGDKAVLQFWLVVVGLLQCDIFKFSFFIFTFLFISKLLQIAEILLIESIGIRMWKYRMWDFSHYWFPHYEVTEWVVSIYIALTPGEAQVATWLFY